MSDRAPSAAEYGRMAYNAYCASVGGVSAVSGDRLPTWDEQVTRRPDIARAWERAAGAVLSAASDQITQELHSIWFGIPRGGT